MYVSIEKRAKKPTREQDQRESAGTWLQREKNNPVLSAADLPEGGACVFNSGAVCVNGEIVMLVNAWDAEWIPRFFVARSDDGIHFTIDSRNRVCPPPEYPYVPHEGIFDTRIVRIEGVYYVTYNVASQLGGRIMLARTTDFEIIETLGFIAGPDHRNCVLFPERIGGRYARLERPHGASEGDIYISYSPDLIYWGDTRLLLEKGVRYWESAKVGPGAPPLRTEEGWLVIYHGARRGMNGYSYQAGVLLLDLDDPSRIIGKLNAPILTPEEPYERIGITPNVVFPVAAVRHGAEDELKVYYGAADTCMCLARGSVRALTEACLCSPFRRRRA